MGSYFECAAPGLRDLEHFLAELQVSSVHPPWCPMRPSIAHMPWHRAALTLRCVAISGCLDTPGSRVPFFWGFLLPAIACCSHRHASSIIYPWLLDGLLTNQLAPMLKNQCLMIIENRWFMILDHRIVDGSPTPTTTGFPSMAASETLSTLLRRRRLSSCEA